MFAAEWGSGQVFWSFLWFFLFMMWVSLAFSIFADIRRAGDMSGFTKAIWFMAVIVLPFLGVFMYLIVNGSQMHQRADRAANDNKEAMQSYIRQTVASSSAEQLTSLAGLHDAGKLTDAEFAAAKATVTAGR